MTSRGTTAIFILFFSVMLAFGMRPPHGMDIIYLCPPKDVFENRACIHGTYVYNPNPLYCQDRTVCYGGPGERCIQNDVKLQCHPRLICNWGQCQGCIGSSDCFTELKPPNATHKRYFGRRFRAYTT